MPNQCLRRAQCLSIEESMCSAPCFKVCAPASSASTCRATSFRKCAHLPAAPPLARPPHSGHAQPATGRHPGPSWRQAREGGARLRQSLPSGCCAGGDGGRAARGQARAGYWQQLLRASLGERCPPAPAAAAAAAGAAVALAAVSGAAAGGCVN